jgi:hypothetical protein
LPQFQYTAWTQTVADGVAHQQLFS